MQKRNFINLPFNSLTPNFLASFVFWGTAFSLTWSISDFKTSTNLAVILKTASHQWCNHRTVIIAGWSEAPTNHNAQFSIIINEIILKGFAIEMNYVLFFLFFFPFPIQLFWTYTRTINIQRNTICNKTKTTTRSWQKSNVTQ